MNSREKLLTFAFSAYKTEASRRLIPSSALSSKENLTNGKHQDGVGMKTNLRYSQCGNAVCEQCGQGRRKVVAHDALIAHEGKCVAKIREKGIDIMGHKLRIGLAGIIFRPEDMLGLRLWRREDRALGTRAAAGRVRVGWQRATAGRGPRETGAESELRRLGFGRRSRRGSRLIRRHGEAAHFPVSRPECREDGRAAHL